jgi:hypothetical protein
MSVRQRLIAAVAAAGAMTAAGLAAAPIAQAKPAAPTPYISFFHTRSTIDSTVPAVNGDVNPYGVFVVRHSIGHLRAGDVLVSNFDASNSDQGTGSTIVQISPSGHRSLFAQISAGQLPSGSCPGGVGLTTALEVLPHGWVVVGSTPSTNGLAATAGPGCLIVLDSRGHVAETFSGNGISGPWDSAMVSRGDYVDLFVTNVFGAVAGAGAVVDSGTVLRLTLFDGAGGPPQLLKTTVIGTGFPEQTNTNAFILGPTGVGLGCNGTLYVAETQSNQIDAIPNALFGPGGTGTGTTLTSGGDLNAPLGLAMAPGGDILTVNGNDGRIVETTPAGVQIDAKYLDRTPPVPLGAGALFGLAVKPHFGGVYYVDDDTNTLRLLH